MAIMNSSSPLSAHMGISSSSINDDKPPMCLSPQDKSKGNVKASLAQRKKVQHPARSSSSSSSLAVNKIPVPALVQDFDMGDDASAMDLDVDLAMDLVEDVDDDHDMDEAGWISDDNLRALEFDDRLNQDIDWVAHDDVETSLKLEFIPTGDEDEQDFVFGPSSFLSPLRGGLSFDDSDMSSSFAESLSVETPPPSFGTSRDAEKLLMSFDTMNFTIPSPTSSSSKKTRANLFGMNDLDGKVSEEAAAKGSASVAKPKGTMSPSLKTKAGAAASDESRKEEPNAVVAKLSVPSPEPFLGVLSMSTPLTATASQSMDSQRKIGSYSPEARRLRIQKFHEKRKNRTWKKSIKYDCRKKLADDRPRIKGRFVRVLENVCDIKEEDTCSTTSCTSSDPSSSQSSVVSSPVPTTASTLLVGLPAMVTVPAKNDITNPVALTVALSMLPPASAVVLTTAGVQNVIASAAPAVPVAAAAVVCATDTLIKVEVVRDD